MKRDLGVKGLQVGDFIEKNGQEYRSLFLENNVVIKNINEDDESEVILVL